MTIYLFADVVFEVLFEQIGQIRRNVRNVRIERGHQPRVKGQ